MTIDDKAAHPQQCQILQRDEKPHTRLSVRSTSMSNRPGLEVLLLCHERCEAYSLDQVERTVLSVTGCEEGNLDTAASSI